MLQVLVAASVVFATATPAQNSSELVKKPMREEQPPPSRGTGYIVAGSILTALGAINLGLTPVCRTEGYRDLADDSGSDICFYGSLIGGGVFAGIGLPLLITGLVKRSRYKTWQEGNLSLHVDPKNRRVAFALRF